MEADLQAVASFGCLVGSGVPGGCELGDLLFKQHDGG